MRYRLLLKVGEKCFIHVLVVVEKNPDAIKFKNILC